MRFNNWDLRLAEYVNSVRSRPFSWGTHDCLTFANDAVVEQRGYGFADDLVGGYTSAKGALLKYRRWLKSTQFNDLVHGMDSRLPRINIKFPPRGAVAAIPLRNGVLPFAFGVAVGRHCCFVDDNGLQFITPKESFLFWGVE